MPLEIRELVIKTSIHPDGQGQNSQSGSASENNEPSDRATIVAACVDQVLAILKDKAER
jgi:hypothetical protein